MGIRPPTGDGIDDAGAVEFGIAAVDGLLEDATVTFPTDLETVHRELGDREVAVDPSGRTVPFARVLEDLEVEEFEDAAAFKEALHPIFEEYRSRSVGLIGTVRAWLGL